MGLDDIIPFLIFFLFFILPSILKGLRQKAAKKKPVKKAKKAKKPSIFSRITDEINRVLKEIEKQQQEQKQKERKEREEPDNIWQMLSGGRAQSDQVESENVAYDDAEYDSEYDPYENEPLTYEQSVKDVPETIEQPGTIAADADQSVREDLTAVFESKPAKIESGRMRRHTLQNAVVWAEILGKPVALK